MTAAGYIDEIFQNILVGGSAAIVKAAISESAPGVGTGCNLVPLYGLNVGTYMDSIYMEPLYMGLGAATRILIQILQTSPRADQLISSKNKADQIMWDSNSSDIDNIPNIANCPTNSRIIWGIKLVCP